MYSKQNIQVIVIDKTIEMMMVLDSFVWRITAWDTQNSTDMHTKWIQISDQAATGTPSYSEHTSLFITAPSIKSHRIYQYLGNVKMELAIKLDTHYLAINSEIYPDHDAEGNKYTKSCLPRLYIQICTWKQHIAIKTWVFTTCSLRIHEYSLRI